MEAEGGAMTTCFPLLKSQEIHVFLKSSFEKVGKSFHPSMAEIESPTVSAIDGMGSPESHPRLCRRAALLVYSPNFLRAGRRMPNVGAGTVTVFFHLRVGTGALSPLRAVTFRRKSRTPRIVSREFDEIDVSQRRVRFTVFSLLDTFQKIFRRKLVSAARISPDTISIEDLWCPSAYCVLIALLSLASLSIASPLDRKGLGYILRCLDMKKAMD